MLTSTKHKGDVTRLMFDLSGEYLFSTGIDGQLLQWSPDGKSQLLYQDSKTISVLAISDKASSIAFGNAIGELFILDRSSKKIQARSKLPFGITGVSFIPGQNNLLVACGNLLEPIQLPKPTVIWDYVKNEYRHIRLGQYHGIRELIHIPGTKQFVQLDDQKKIHLYDLTKNSPLASFQIPKMGKGLTVSLDGRSLAANFDWHISIYNLEKKQPKCELKGHRGLVSAIAFDHSGQLLYSCSWDETVRCWDIALEKEVEVLNWSIGRATAIACAMDGSRVAVGSENGTVLVWDRN